MAGRTAPKRVSAKAGLASAQSPSRFHRDYEEIYSGTVRPPPEPSPLKGEGGVGVESTWYLFKKEVIQ